jgi:signal peptidase I
MQINGGSRSLSSAFRYAHALFGTVAVLLVGFLVINGFVFTLFRVNGHSMEKTLQNGTFIPACSICAHLQKPALNQIVIVEYEGSEHVRFVKRVLGTPGMSLPFKGGTVVLAEDEYFVVGDNRGASTDSRVYGPIHRSQIVAYVLGNYGTGPGPL